MSKKNPEMNIKAWAVVNKRTQTIVVSFERVYVFTNKKSAVYTAQFDNAWEVRPVTIIAGHGEANDDK